MMYDRRTTGRRGVTSVLAMLFMVLFAVLAIGFVATVNSAVQISGNEQRGVRAMLAAESGMNFIRYHLWDLSVQRSLPPDQLFDKVYEQLQDRLDGTANLGGGNIARVGDTILIPGNPTAFMNADSEDGAFRIEIRRQGMELVVTSIGRSGQAESKRGIQLTYAIYSRPSAIFDFGIASKSPIQMIGNTSVQGKNNPAHGSVLSTSYRVPALKMQGNSMISGDVSFANPSSSALDITGNNSIGGYKPSQSGFNDHVHFGVDEPEFPTIDTSAFKDWLEANPHTVITGSPSGKNFGSLRIKANANPTFNGNTKIKGLVYIETPNRVSFSGNLDLQGVIVVENNPKGDSTTNLIDFGGNVDFEGVHTLDASFGELRNLDGAMLLAPGFKLQMRGNFGVIGGAIAADEMEFSGNAGGTVKGSIINLKDTMVTLHGNTDIIIESQGTTDTPAGMFFGSRYVPLPDTYKEIIP